MRIIVGQSQACEILMTIPGVGIQTPAAFGAAIIMASRLGDVAGIVTLQRWRSTAELLELGGTVLAYIWLATSSWPGAGGSGGNSSDSAQKRSIMNGLMFGYCVRKPRLPKLGSDPW